eukprot:TRINITY_DN9962_c0_g1::TRINITY_DN9962_c0_g1_i1::g.29205::m.29205 TRINITY_DN9962_c0_g1::TRINITY_DN9962_c0_g1_i1::g.29205  ORF type:complete len:261 (+),score=21.88,CUE/PF02845.11/5.1e-05 TRINITY_DN9962_c0_g1_i1:121-903(+)
MSVSYEEALQTLDSMFAGQFDREILASVLASQGNHLERTVETLLQMSGEVDSAPPPPSQFAPVPTPAYPPSSLAMGGLPDDFLRLPSDSYGSRTAEEMSQIEADAELAKMLQDELFLQDLQRNPEWNQVLRDEARMNPGYSSQGMSQQPQFAPMSIALGSSPSRSQMVGFGNTPAQEEIPLKDRLQNFSLVTKNKLKAFAESFKEKKNQRKYESFDESPGMTNDDEESSLLRRSNQNTRDFNDEYDHGMRRPEATRDAFD